MPGAQKSCAITPLLNWTGEKKYGKRLVDHNKDRETSLASYLHGQSRLNFRKVI